MFYTGKPPKGVKTNWIMHEYRLAESLSPKRVAHARNSSQVNNLGDMNLKSKEYSMRVRFLKYLNIFIINYVFLCEPKNYDIFNSVKKKKNNSLCCLIKVYMIYE